METEGYGGELIDLRVDGDGSAAWAVRVDDPESAFPSELDLSMVVTSSLITDAGDGWWVLMFQGAAKRGPDEEPRLIWIALLFRPAGLSMLRSLLTTTLQRIATEGPEAP
jgi:hypothetical protein